MKHDLTPAAVWREYRARAGLQTQHWPIWAGEEKRRLRAGPAVGGAAREHP